MCDSVICWGISACQSEILYTYLLTIFDSYSLPVVISQLQAVIIGSMAVENLQQEWFVRAILWYNTK